MPFRADHPQHREGQSFGEHQEEMAAWVGTTVEGLNAAHDALHASLSAFLGLPSHALRQAAGEPLTSDEQRLADIEEDAVLSCQRWAAHAEGVRE